MTCVHQIRDKGTGFDHMGHSLMTADALTNAQQVQLTDNAMRSS